MTPAASNGVHGLMMLADASAGWKHDPIAQARLACAGGASCIQLRAKATGDRRVLEWAEAIRALTHEHAVRFFVNDRFDLALAAEADGVHLGQDDLPPGRIPSALRERLEIGRSTHTIEQAQRALAEAVDYIAFGPIFATASKASVYAPRGLEMLAEVVRICAPLPVIAIGGIDIDNAPLAAATGAAGFAVISAVAAADDPQRATRALVDAWQA